MNIPFVKYRNFYFSAAAILVALCLFSIFSYGFKPGIDFTGGSILEVQYKENRPSNAEIENQLAELKLEGLSVQPAGDKDVILRMKDITDETHNQILDKLGKAQGTIEEKRFESIGATVGKELRAKTMNVIALGLIAMFIYIATAFHKIQRPLKSWCYGFVSFITLAFDVIIPLGAFALLGKKYGVEISIPVIAALLTVIGYSINNTVVVFDRMRENILKKGGIFVEIVDASINQTLIRQINSTLTVLFMTIPIYLFGGDTLKYFALSMILGVSAGLFSSIFLASPLLVSWHNWKEGRYLAKK